MSQSDEPDAILIVDDDESTRHALSLVLSKTGYAVDAAATAQEALEKAGRQAYGAALLDVRLPDASGTDLLRQLKQLRPDLAAIVVTGYATVETAMEAVNVGAWGYISKPLDMNVVLVTLRRALEKRRLDQENRTLLAQMQTELAQRGKTEQELRRLQAFNKRLVDSMTEGIALTDGKGKLVFVNATGAQMLGYTPHELRGQDWHCIIGPGQEAVLYRVQERRKAGRPHVFEMNFVTRGGGSLPVLVSAARFVEPDGNIPGGALVVFTDITELTAMRRDLERAATLEAVGRVAGGMAHELGNLLTVVSVGSDLVERGLRRDDPLLECVQAIRTASGRASALNKQLLSFSRLEVVLPQVIELNPVIRGIEPMLRALLTPRIALTLALAEDLWSVQADRAQMESVLTNMVMNARDAMPVGGELAIASSNVALGDGFVSTRVGCHAGQYVLLQVRDTGVGMDETVKAHLFEPFYTTKARGRGTGLGLAAVHGTIKQAGGFIEVVSAVGEGTTFQIYLPRCSPAAVQAEPLPAVAAKAVTQTILLVEDMDEVRRVTRGILDNLGYHVLEAGDGRQALDAFRVHDGGINLLSTDMALPDMTGEQLAAALTKEQPGLPVLYITAYLDEATRIAVGQGAVVLAKPFSMEDLQRKVRDLLESHPGRPS